MGNYLFETLNIKCHNNKVKNKKFKLKKGKKVITLNLLYFEESDKEILKNSFNMWKTLSETLKKDLYATRSVNLPEALSEAIVCLDLKIGKLISHKGSNFSTSFDCFDEKTKKRIQIKGSSSSGPSQFGPRSEQDIYYFIDFFADKKIDGKYKIYEISNAQIDNTMVNERETVKQKAQKTGQRPRFDVRAKIVEPLKLKPIFEGDLSN